MASESEFVHSEADLAEGCNGLGGSRVRVNKNAPWSLFSGCLGLTKKTLIYVAPPSGTGASLPSAIGQLYTANQSQQVPLSRFFGPALSHRVPYGPKSVLGLCSTCYLMGVQRALELIFSTLSYIYIGLIK